MHEFITHTCLWIITNMSLLRKAVMLLVRKSVISGGGVCGSSPRMFWKNRVLNSANLLHFCKNDGDWSKFPKCWKSINWRTMGGVLSSSYFATPYKRHATPTFTTTDLILKEYLALLILTGRRCYIMCKNCLFFGFSHDIILVILQVVSLHLGFNILILTKFI